MKKVLLIAAALIISFSLMSCSKSDDKKIRNDITPFEGTWAQGNLEEPQYIFRGKTITLAHHTGVHVFKGTFTYSEDEIIFLYTHVLNPDTSSWEPYTGSDSVTGYSFEADGSLYMYNDRYTRVQS
jgi:hypothetical protein